jgi:hypothetical protein
LKKSNFYYWASDLRKNSGEGVLGNKFLSDLKKYYNNTAFIKISQNHHNYSTFYNKYFLNLFGALKLWKYYFKGYRTVYINYLPIWNFTIFLILPPKTILGPITGSLIYDKQSLLQYILRGILIKILKDISLFIIFFRQKKILFSTELLKSIIPKKKYKICYFNYVFKVFPGFQKKKNKRNIDFLIYNRSHNNRNNALIEYFINNTSEEKFKIIVVGDPINSSYVHNKGYINRNKLLSLLANTKFTFGSSENLYTLFVLDAISKNVTIFCDKNLKKSNILKYKKLFLVNFTSFNKTTNYIVNKEYKFKNKNIKNNFIKNNYEKYFV